MTRIRINSSAVFLDLRTGKDTIGKIEKIHVLNYSTCPKPDGTDDTAGDRYTSPTEAFYQRSANYTCKEIIFMCHRLTSADMQRVFVLSSAVSSRPRIFHYIFSEFIIICTILYIIRKGDKVNKAIIYPFSWYTKQL